MQDTRRLFLLPLIPSVRKAPVRFEARILQAVLPSAVGEIEEVEKVPRYFAHREWLLFLHFCCRFRWPFFIPFPPKLMKESRSLFAGDQNRGETFFLLVILLPYFSSRLLLFVWPLFGGRATPPRCTFLPPLFPSISSVFLSPAVMIVIVDSLFPFREIQLRSGPFSFLLFEVFPSPSYLSPESLNWKSFSSFV